MTRKLTDTQLTRLREIAVAMLESPPKAQADLGIAPEDLMVACDRALGWDEMADESVEERRALAETSRERCLIAWRKCHG